MEEAYCSEKPSAEEIYCKMNSKETMEIIENKNGII